MRHYVKAGLVIVTAFGLATGAQAATATGTMTVTATVLSTCLVVATPLAFGIYTPTQTGVTNGQTTLAVTCTTGTPYNVGLNAGTGTGATVATRKMTFGSNTLNYSLYQDSGYSTVWGSSIGTNTQTGTGTGLLQTLTVYGQIAAQQSVPAGAYTDSVTVTLTY